ncbi:1,4-alpha-glucan branching protein [Streptomyces sp. NBC_01387]|uniref:maltokinase N-terminal cap-like domain-containing protein n=1 Tax=unclassified Streptomyces TaxID=2593676 RepID=UPI002DD8909E|nr:MULTISPECIES: 1,4-alpha-glucan branching protein [unclassified Streptomyces]WSC24040.1 1,4-alpha-glucan branching protein [Streptomyces sp. NBC_01766]WSV57923.1 1,4-alpha-glucan branching protein [Streptomyces sp. NBC_01014]
MAVVHRTTLTPTKLELLASWLPEQSWYRGSGHQPELTKAGGFRLDDPQGEVGIEFMAVTDDSGDGPVTYQVPLTYRGAPLDGADHALIGTSEHGVLGQRWVYDGAHDPVLAAQLFALVVGAAEPQAQNASNSPDPTVTSRRAGSCPTSATGPTAVADGPDATEIGMRTPAGPGRLTLRVNRVLRPEQPGRPGQDGSSDSAAGSLGQVSAEWLLPDGTRARGLFAVVQD